MIDLSDEARTLIELARDAHDPGDDDRARVRAALAARIGVAAGLGLAAGLGAAAKTTVTTATAGAGAGLTVGAVGAGAGALKLIGAALVVSATLGAGAAAVHHARRASVARVAVAEQASPPSPRPKPTAASPVALPVALPVAAPVAVPAARPQVVAPASASIPRSTTMDPLDGRPSVSGLEQKLHVAHAIVPAPKEGPGDGAGVRAAPPPRPSAPDVADVADEASLFHDGIMALRSGQPARALVLFDLHARQYPHGVLAEEREAERALALADLGRTTEARAAIERFLQAHATSPLAARLLARARLLDPAEAKADSAEPRPTAIRRHDP